MKKLEFVRHVEQTIWRWSWTLVHTNVCNRYGQTGMTWDITLSVYVQWGWDETCINYTKHMNLCDIIRVVFVTFNLASSIIQYPL